VPSCEETEVRRNALCQRFVDQQIHGALITSPANLFYFAGVWLETGERMAALVLKENGDAVFIAHEMFQREVGKAHVSTSFYRDGDNPYLMLISLLGPSGIVAVDGAWSAAHLLGLQEAGKNVRYTSLQPHSAFLRSRKSISEMASLAHASHLADEVVQAIKMHLCAGQTERAIANRLADLWQEAGASGMSFPAIVASGVNSSAPHHEPDTSPLVASTVIVDTGGIYEHYCSDITRTYILGEPTDEMVRVYEVLVAAQKEGISAARPGATLQSVDRVVRRVIEEAGYGKYFTHRTGHGVGLDIHEDPFVVEGNFEVLQPGMVMSVEPGIYIPGQFGIRIEDLVAIMPDGSHVLNAAPKDLEQVILQA
jgi:Xaa-Pro dipeptidase